MDPYFQKKISEAKENQLGTLILTPPNIGKGPYLAIVPPEIFEMTWLKELDLSKNNIEELPESIGRLTNLEKLNISENQLTYLPESIGELENLKNFDVSGNQLTTLPESIENLKNLKRFFLVDNQLASLPESIGKQTSLTVLDLEGNQLKSLPESIGDLTDLEVLYLASNQLAELPESIVNLKKLAPGKNWRQFIEGNPLKFPPLYVAEKGIEEIERYFRQIQEVGVDYLYEAKLIIVGEPGAGKTTLARKLKKEDAPLPTKEESTRGIEISKWEFHQNGKPKFRVNIWDFAGQEIYSATHRFFLTHRSMYVIVADSRKDDTDFFYWLESIKLFGGESPALIVANETDDRKRRFNVTQLKKMFPQFKDDPISCNLKTRRGLSDIQKQIKRYIKKLPQIGDPLPKTWVKVRQDLEDLESAGGNYISRDEFFRICEKAGFKREEDKLQLSDHLHILGVCLHFQDDPVLKHYVFLKPEWCTNAVYKIFDNKQIYKNSGRFTSDDVGKIWTENSYKQMKHELLRLMENFKLCYKVRDRDLYISPQWLDENPPGYTWDDKDNLYFRYEYKFMPKGIVWDLIVRLHELIHNEYVWGSGFILEKNGARGEVIEKLHDRCITIRISGNNKVELMSVIRNEFDQIHERFKGRLSHEEFVPCNCETCKTSKDPHLFQLKRLKMRLHHNYPTIQCDNPPFSEVKIVNLLCDIGITREVGAKGDRRGNSTIINIQQGGKGMKNVNTGDISSGGGDVTIGIDSIQKSFNALEKSESIQQDARTLLETLLNEINEINKKVSDDQKDTAENMAKDAETLIKEATSSNPRKRWYELSIDGMKEAANALGHIAAPVVKILQDLKPLLLP